jgi:hypothetical protein
VPIPFLSFCSHDRPLPSIAHVTLPPVPLYPVPGNACRLSLAHYRPHTNSKNSTHFILNGEFTIVYTKQGTRQTICPGGRIDIPAGLLHEVLTGKGGCTYIIGEK